MKKNLDLNRIKKSKEIELTYYLTKNFSRNLLIRDY